VVLAVTGRRIVVIAPDSRGAETAEMLVDAGASVTFIGASAPASAAADRVKLIERPYVRGDLAGAFAVICLESGEIADAVFAEAEAVSCLAHFSERPELSSFRFMSLTTPTASEEPR